MQIASALWIESGTYNDMVMRPFKTNSNTDTMAMFQEATQGGLNITAPAIAGLAGLLVRPSAAPQGNIAIPNGFGERRLRFVMEVISNVGYGSWVKQMITGYTDHPGVLVHSSTATFDPNMRVFFNNSIELRTVVEDTPNGRAERTMVSDSSHLLAVPKNQLSSVTGVQTMRPQDIYGTMATQLMDDQRGEVFDHRTTFLEGVKKSRRSNAIGADYIARMLQCAHGAVNNQSNYTSDASQIYQNAGHLATERYVHQDHFIGRLARETDYNNCGFVTFGQLARMFPELDHVSKVTVRGQTQRISGPTAERGASEFFTGTTAEATIATSLAHSVPAIMMDLMIAKLVFIATNEVIGTDYMVEIRQCDGFAKGVDMTPFAQQLIMRLKTEILADITSNNQITFRLQMAVNVVGDTFITISYAGGYDTEFVVPSFCDALSSPMITNNPMDLTVMATDMDQLYNYATSQPQIIPTNAPRGQRGGIPSYAAPNAPTAAFATDPVTNIVKY